MNEEHHEDAFSDVSTEQRDRLITVLDELESHIKRQNSLKLTFAKGVVYGLGTVVGATILVALFGGMIANTINNFSDEPILNENLQVSE